MKSHIAFVSTFATTSLSQHSVTGNYLSQRRPSTGRVMTEMAVQAPQKPKVSSFSRLEENRVAKLESEYLGPQGFTPYAEKVNGRLAQMGFVIGLITEIVSGKPMGEQMLIMFSPLTHAVTALFSVIAN